MKVKTVVYAGLLAGIQTVCAAFWVPINSDELLGVHGGLQDSLRREIIDNSASIMPLLTFTNDSLLNFAMDGRIADINPGWQATTVVSGANQAKLSRFSQGKWIKVDQPGVFAGQAQWQLQFQDGSAALPVEYLTVANTERADNSQIPISEVPLSATAWIFLSGLMGYLAFSKSKQRKH